MANNSFNKSTIVRVQETALRGGFATADRISPRAAARLAERLWFTLPQGPRAHADPPGGTNFTVRSQGADVRGMSWGDGPVVYLVHGWGGRGSQLNAFVEPLVHDGLRVVTFDAPSHGRSDAGPSGAGRSNAVELGRAVDAVATRFGPAHAVVAHSLGAMAVLLAMRHGWLGVRRLALVAPILDIDEVLDIFTARLAIGARTRHHLGQRIAARTGLSLDSFSATELMADRRPTLVLHDRTDRQAPYNSSSRLASDYAEVSLVTTSGLGHRRILRDPGVVAAAAMHIAAPLTQPRAATLGSADLAS